MKDTTPQCVKDVLDKPGKYRFEQAYWFWFFEVDDKGRVYQLNPRTMTRDGLLAKDGWGESANTGIVSKIEGHI